MPGRPRMRLKEKTRQAEEKALALEAAGSPDAPFARTRAEFLKRKLEEAYADVPKDAGRNAANTIPARPTPRKDEHERKKRAVRFVGCKAAARDEMSEPGSVRSEAGALATEIAVEGVRPGFLYRPALPPSPLTPEEYDVAKTIVATVTSDTDAGYLSQGDIGGERWLAETFPTLDPDTRVRCVRFLCAMATMAAEAPCHGTKGATVAEKALEAAGLSYVAFECARSKDARFDDAQAAVSAARKRGVMNRLEETLQHRAFEGQMEETLTRDGEIIQLRKYDNNLAFNLLKYGHEQYGKQLLKDKAAANAMTLMIANGGFPQSPQVPVPKQAEVIDVK